MCLQLANPKFVTWDHASFFFFHLSVFFPSFSAVSL